jgi:O-antigen/teichoic acid export membrane protein
MSEKKRILQNTMKNSYSQLIVKVFGVIQGLIVANILGPALYGIKNAFSLFQQYGNYSGLGVFSVYYRTLCEKIDDADCANNMNSDIFGFVVFVSFVLFILFTGIAFLFFNSVAERLTLIIIALGVISSIFCSFYRLYILSKQNFNVTSMANILSSFVLLVFGILLTYFITY